MMPTRRPPSSRTGMPETLKRSIIALTSLTVASAPTVTGESMIQLR